MSIEFNTEIAAYLTTENFDAQLQGFKIALASMSPAGTLIEIVSTTPITRYGSETIRITYKLNNPNF